MSEELKKRIMRRVYAIWFVKRVAPAVFIYMPFLLFVALKETAGEFFVSKILDNFLIVVHNHGLTGVFKFIISAFGNAPALPLFIILVSAGIFVYILRKTVGYIRNLAVARI